MTRIVIKKLIWDRYNVEHIKKHNVEVREAEEAVENFIAHKKGKQGRYIAVGRSGSRLISLVKREGAGLYYLVTARDSDKDERRRVHEKEKI